MGFEFPDPLIDNIGPEAALGRASRMPVTMGREVGLLLVVTTFLDEASIHRAGTELELSVR